MSEYTTEDRFNDCRECELISKCQYAFKPYLLIGRKSSDDGLGLCKKLKESDLGINYPYEYGRLKAKSEDQAEEIQKLKDFLFDLAYYHPRNKELQSFIKRNFYLKEYENYSLNRKKSTEE